MANYWLKRSGWSSKLSFHKSYIKKIAHWTSGVMGKLKHDPSKIGVISRYQWYLTVAVAQKISSKVEKDGARCKHSIFSLAN